MEYTTWICFWPLISIILLIRKDLYPFWKWRNIFAVIAIGFLTIFFFRSPVAKNLYVTAISLCTDSYIPFYDQLSTSLALVIREEVMKGMMIAVLLICVKRLNPQMSMQWIVVIVPLYICNLFAWHEAMGYYQVSFMNTTFLARTLFPVHFIFQIPMVFILFKYYDKEGKINQTLIFCGSLCAAIGIHFLWNVCVTLDNDLYKYMAANVHYLNLSYICTFVKIASATLLSIWVIYLWLRVFSHSQQRSYGNRFLQQAGDVLIKIVKGKVYFLPVTSIVLIGTFVTLGLYQYHIQDIKPLQMIGDLWDVKKNNVKIYTDNHSLKKIDLTTLPLVQAIDKGKIAPQKPYNYNLIPKYRYKPTELYKISIFGYKQYLLYKDIVIGYFPDNDNKKVLSIIP